MDAALVQRLEVVWIAFKLASELGGSVEEEVFPARSYFPSTTNSRENASSPVELTNRARCSWIHLWLKIEDKNIFFTQ
jgi:hypothetical protein